MICVHLIVDTIPYEQNLQTLFPLFLRSIRQAKSEHPLLRFLQTAGEDLEPALLALLSGLSEEEKDELACFLVCAYGGQLAGIINQAQPAGSGIFQVERISASREGESIRLILAGVTVDGDALLQNEALQSRAADFLPVPIGRFLKNRVMPHLFSGRNPFPWSGERIFDYLLRQQAAKEVLLRSAERTLAEHSVFLHLADLTLGEEPAPPVNVGRMSRELEEKLLDGAARLLRTAVRP